MTRIVAGAAGGRRIAVPPGSATRPTSDRAREGLFSTLSTLLGPLDGSLDGLAMLDLYAGTGAVGLEALSRGAARVVFVESDARALRTLRANLRELGLAGGQVVPGRVAALVAAGPGPQERGSYDVAFLDPPYAVRDPEVGAVLRGLRTGGWLAESAVVVVERSSRGAGLPWPEGYEPLRARRYGEGTLWYGRACRHVVERDGGQESRREA